MGYYTVQGEKHFTSKEIGKLRVGTFGKLRGKMMTWWDPAFQFERTTITSFLCLGRAKPHSSGEQLPRHTTIHEF